MVSVFLISSAVVTVMVHTEAELQGLCAEVVTLNKGGRLHYLISVVLSEGQTSLTCEEYPIIEKVTMATVPSTKEGGRRADKHLLLRLRKVWSAWKPLLLQQWWCFGQVQLWCE